MTASLATLPKGHEFAPASFLLTRDWVDAYAAAVDDRAIAALGADAVPPMAVATLSVRALLEASPLPPGSLHAGQELAFRRAVKVGAELTVAARIVSRGERAGWVLMSLDLDVTSSGGQVMTGRATITFPLDGAA